MEKKLVSSEYQQLFSTEGMSYLTSDIFMDYYRNLGAIATFAHNKWTSFLPKKIMEITLAEGLERFKSDKLFTEFKAAFENYYEKTDIFFGQLLSENHISRERCAEAFDRFTENFVHYSKTEFFYVDEAYRLADTDPTVKRHLKKFEALKNDGRTKMNAILFQPDSYRKNLIKRLATQFGLPYDDLLMYGKKEINNLYSGIKIDDAILRAREVAYIMISRQSRVSSLWGKEAEKAVDDFFAQDSQDAGVDAGNESYKGTIAHKGKATGRVTLVKYGDNVFSRLPDIISKMPEGNVLVADSTSPELIMACRKASAILTNQGGMMSHAAIVSRELNIPCIVGLKNITEKVKEGDMVEVDADNGIVRILEKNRDL